MFKVNNKGTKTSQMVFLLLTWDIQLPAGIIQPRP